MVAEESRFWVDKKCWYFLRNKSNLRPRSSGMSVGVKTPPKGVEKKVLSEDSGRDDTKKCAASKQCTAGRSADVLRQHSGKQTNRPMRLGR